MRQAKPAPDQAATGKDFLDFFGRGARGHVKILWNFAEQQVPDASANQECFEAGFLQIPDDIGGIWAEIFEPNTVLGLGNGEIIINIGLRGLTG
jgi:hypothetical protein